MTDRSASGAARPVLERRAMLAVLAGAAGAACAPARAQAPSPLRALLGMAAAELVASDTTEIYRFLDLAALRALGVAAPEERTVVAWPDHYGEALAQAQSWPAMLGFARDDVAQLLQVGGDSPRAPTFLAGRFDARAIGSALLARGFAAHEVDGSAVWRRRNDDGADLANREPADPFGGMRGRPARLALLGGRLAFAASDTGIALAIAAAAQRADSVLDYDEVNILTAAAEADLGGGGRLVQAIVLVAAPLRDVDAALAAAQGDAEIARLPTAEARRSAVLARPPFPLLRANPLPQAALVLLGERRSAAGATAFVALNYDEPDEARAAALALAARIAGYFPLLDPARPNLVEAARGTVAQTLIATPEGHAAVVAVTTPGSLAGASSSLFSQWCADADRHAFWPLWSG